jgi:peptide/nickel transport system substrate-binding protein
VNHRLGRRWMALGTIAVSAAGIGATGAMGATPVKGGGVVFGQEVLPDCLGPMLTDCFSIYANRIISNGMVLENLLTADAKGRYIPDLATRVPTGNDVNLRRGVLSITFHIQPKAAWSDGKPFTADDVIFTWKTIMNKKNSIVSRTGWQDIASIKKQGPKQVTVTFKKGKTYAAWKDLFSLGGGTQMLPKHILQGKDYNTVWNNGGFDTKVPLIGTGPFLLKSYSPESTTLVPNPKYWAKSLKKGGPFLASVTMNSGLGSTGVVTGIKSGELNTIDPLPSNLALINTLPGTPGVAIQSKPAYSIEHIALNTEAAPLNDAKVRQALAYALDRNGVTKGLLGGQVPTLQSGPALVPAIAGYKPVFSKYTYNPAKAQQILQADGWTKGSDGIFSKGGQRLSIKVNFTPTNQQRRNNLNYLASKAQAAGIELVPNPDANIFSQSLPNGTFQAAEFGFSGSPDPTQSSLLAANQIPTDANNHAGQNYYRYSGVSALTQKSDYIVSDVHNVPTGIPFGGPARAKALTAMQEKLANDVPFVPLYVSPNTLATKNTLVGPQVNLTQVDPFWNTAVWFFKGGKS